MTLPYSTQAGKIAYQEATALWRAINFRAGDFKALRGLSADLKQLSSIRTGARAATNPISAAYKKLEFDIGKSSKKISVAEKTLDQIKRGAFKEINPKWGAALNVLLNVAMAGVTILSIKSNEAIQAINLANGKRSEADLQDAFTRGINNSIQIRGQQKQLEALKQGEQRVRDRVYAVEKEQIKQRKSINDITYEVRQGRKIVENKLSTEISKANTRIKELTDKFQKALGNTTNNAQNTIQATIQKLQQQVTELQKASNKPSNTNANQEVRQLQTKVDTLTKTVEVIPRNIERLNQSNNNTIAKVVNAAFTPIQQAQRKWGVTITPAQVNYPTITYSTGGIVVPTLATVTPAQVTFGQFSSSDLGQQARVLAQDEAEKVEIQVNAVNGRLSTGFELIAQARAVADAALREAKIKGVPINTIEIENRIKQQELTFNTKLNNVNTEIDNRIRQQESKLNTGLNNVNTKIGNIERVNERSERKLDQILPTISQILPTIAGIPLIAARATADVIRPDIPTISGIEAATGRAMCNNLKTGCGKAAIDDAVGNVTNNVNQHNTNNTGSILDAINTGANAALLQGQQTILARLGDQLPGGLSGKLQRFSKWLHLDRALNMMIWATTIHNALMLSSDIGQTLLGAISNVLQLFGLRDSEGQAFDLGSIISSSIENLIKGIIGADNYTQLRETWAKANRIYQATINIFNSVQGLLSTILNALEITAGRVGKIGNALRRSGEVLDNAYGWMNPQPKFNRVTQFLETLQNGASTIQMVTQAPLDVINAVTETTNASTEFVNALKEDGNPNNKGTNDQEPEQLKAEIATSKLVSVGLDMTEETFQPDED